MQRADVKTVMHTTQCPYFQQLLGSKRNTRLSILLFSYLDGIFCISFALKLSLFFLGMLILSLTFRSFEFHPTMWFSASLSFDCHLQTPGQPAGVTWIGPGGPCIWKDPCWVPCWVVSMCIWTSPVEQPGKERQISIPLWSQSTYVKMWMFHPDVKWPSEVLTWKEVVGFGFT